MSFIDYLKDAQLVANFQNYFGIHLINVKNCNGQIIDKIDDKQSTNDENLKQRFKNDHHHSFKNGTIKNGQTKNLIRDSDLKKNEIEHQSNHKSTKKPNENYVINNLIFYYIFCFGASLGYEGFYALFFPFFLHNIDSFIGRRLILIWSITMYIGQALKDIIRWSRPKSPPVVVLEPEYSLEYGMPSTHAMVGFVLPFSIFIFTQSRYFYPFWIGFALACAWCLLVCTSRLYLGMHTVLDILVGLCLSATILFILAHFIDLIDEFNLKNLISPFISFSIVVLMSIYYPKSDRWSPARGDTCVMVGFGYGIQVGSWLNYQFGIMNDPLTSSLPSQIYLPNGTMILLIVLRTLIAISSIELIRKLSKKVIYPLLCNVQNLNSKDTESKKVPSVEVPLKLITYSLIGIDIAYLNPIIFRFLKIY